jgi:hypothetical protein
VYANAVPATQVLPSSFYLAGKPSWWGSVPWPAIGPDVTSGNLTNTGGHANRLPAQVCFEGMADDPGYTAGTVRVFAPVSCYATSGIGSTSGGGAKHGLGAKMGL